MADNRTEVKGLRTEEDADASLSPEDEQSEPQSSDLSTQSLVLPKSALLSKEVAYLHRAYVVNQGSKFFAELWSDDPAIRHKAEMYVKHHPREFHARMKAFELFFGKTQSSNPSPQSSQDVIDVEKLEEMNLSDAELKRIAGIKDKK